MRLVDSPAYARLEKLLVKVVEELPDPRLDLLLDGSGSMGVGAPSPHERAALRSRRPGRRRDRARGARDRVVGRRAGGAPRARPAGRARGPPPLAGRADAARRRSPAGGRGPRGPLGPGPGKAVLLTDGLEPAAGAEAARRLASGGFDAQLVVVSPADELEPDVAEAGSQAGLVVLVDAETGARREAPFARVALEVARTERDRRRSALLAALEGRGMEAETLPAGAPSRPWPAGSCALPAVGEGGRPPRTEPSPWPNRVHEVSRVVLSGRRHRHLRDHEARRRWS